MTLASQAEVSVPEEQRNHKCFNPKFESSFPKDLSPRLSRKLLSHTSDFLIQLRRISNIIFSYHPATIKGVQSNIIIPCPVIAERHKGQAENKIMLDTDNFLNHQVLSNPSSKICNFSRCVG